MKVTVISEECHGYIGIAKDFESAVDFLLTNHWIDSQLEIWDKIKWIRLDKVFGDNWEEEVRNMSKEDFKIIFDSSFFLEELTVYGT